LKKEQHGENQAIPSIGNYLNLDMLLNVELMRTLPVCEELSLEDKVSTIKMPPTTSYYCINPTDLPLRPQHPQAGHSGQRLLLIPAQRRNNHPPEQHKSRQYVPQGFGANAGGRGLAQVNSGEITEADWAENRLININTCQSIPDTRT